MEQSSIGIIGGADGPTAILVSGNPLLTILEVLGVAAVIVAVIAIFVKQNK